MKLDRVSRLKALLSVGMVLLAATASSAMANQPPEVRLVIRDHRFVPSEPVVPANIKFKLIVVNEDATPEEFESHVLNREKVVTGHATIPVYISPLKPGRYPFFGDFHSATAQGALLAK